MWAESPAHPNPSTPIPFCMADLEHQPETWTGAESLDRESWSVAMVNLQARAVRHYFDDLFVWWVDPHGDGRFDRALDGFRIDHMMTTGWEGETHQPRRGFLARRCSCTFGQSIRDSIIAEQAD